MADGEILFFGYGIYKNKEKIKEIIGNEPRGGHDAVVEEWDLAIQVLDQIPEKPRKIIEKVYGEGFRSYTLRRGNGMVAGKIWKISRDDFEKIKRWNFINIPRNNPKDNWREIVDVSVKAVIDGKAVLLNAVTEKVTDTLPVKELVDDPLSYDAELNKEINRINDEKRLRESNIVRDREQMAHYRAEIDRYINGYTS